MWTLVISVIFATDMVHHFELFKTFNTLHDSQAFTFDNANHHVLLKHLVLICCDIWNVARQFDDTDKWCDVICEEFFRQDDLEMVNGMEDTSRLNDD
jgi:hypothetical protein